MDLNEIEIGSPPLSGNRFVTAGRFIRYFLCHFIRMLEKSQWIWRCFWLPSFPEEEEGTTLAFELLEQDEYANRLKQREFL
jgi:hypothetical protein